MDFGLDRWKGGGIWRFFSILLRLFLLPQPLPVEPSLDPLCRTCRCQINELHDEKKRLLCSQRDFGAELIKFLRRWQLCSSKCSFEDISLVRFEAQTVNDFRVDRGHDFEVSVSRAVNVATHQRNSSQRQALRPTGWQVLQTIKGYQPDCRAVRTVTDRSTCHENVCGIACLNVG